MTVAMAQTNWDVIWKAVRASLEHANRTQVTFRLHVGGQLKNIVTGLVIRKRPMNNFGNHERSARVGLANLRG
jgi:hypothetical protein